MSPRSLFGIFALICGDDFPAPDKIEIGDAWGYRLLFRTDVAAAERWALVFNAQLGETDRIPAREGVYDAFLARYWHGTYEGSAFEIVAYLDEATDHAADLGGAA